MKRELIIGKYTLESLTNGMYASPLDMYREYIQNAVDSFDEAIEQEIDNPDKFAIDIIIDEGKKSIVIKDNGCGVKANEAESALLDIGNSQKNRTTLRGFRGIGRLAGLSYCKKLTFRTSYKGENVATIIEFDAALLKQLLLSDKVNSVTVEDVIDKVVTVSREKEAEGKRYFLVELTGVWNEAGLVDTASVELYLTQHSPLYYSKDFKWGRTITEKLRLNGFAVPQYRIFLNGKELFKPYQDSFVSDRVKRNTDSILDVKIKSFYRNQKLSAILWYAETHFFGTIIDNTIKGIRIRQGNILIGDKGSCSHLFKEERFNGWMIGELHILDSDLIVNSRRDGFEKNTAYYELLSSLRDWAQEVSKEIRHLSYERNLSETKREIIKADSINDIPDENNLYSEDLDYAEEYGESSTLDMDESLELAETDFISKLDMLINQKKAQTKYTVLNISEKFNSEQRKTLERVIDLIVREFSNDEATKIVDLIVRNF